MKYFLVSMFTKGNRRFIIQSKYTPLNRICFSIFVMLSVFGLTASAQSVQRVNGKKIMRCATMENLDSWRKAVAKNPGLVTAGEAIPGNNATSKTVDQTGTAGAGPATKETDVAATIYVPVVVHIVLPNATLVSDADVIKQIEILNTDFAGANTDAADLPATFKPLFGKTTIQFVLARRDPNGNITNGIERRNIDTRFDPNSYPDPIKRRSLGGLDAWDGTKYYNVWVGNSVEVDNSITLGYAPFPGTETNADQGASINYVSFGTNSCYTYTGFDLGRTLVHETGHYFGLYHIWGDDDGCSGDDFRALDGVTLPATLYNPAGRGNTSSDIGDTPNMGSSTSGCASGVQLDACITTSPGRMYQNFMDYTNDACYRLFTLKQVARMEWIINNTRASLITSDKGSLPTGTTSLDVAARAFINPTGSETINCTSYIYAKAEQCPNPIEPSALVMNTGTTTITSLKAELRVNGQSVSTQTLTVNLKTAELAKVTFPQYTPVVGDNILTLVVSSPNNGTDQNKLNDTLQYNYKVSQSGSLPLVEGFEGTTFPPANWLVEETPEDDITWQRTTRAAKSGAASAYMNNFAYEANSRIDDLISPQLSFNDADSVFLKFDVAAAVVSNPTTTMIDTLTVFVSTDCGVTYQQVYKKWGNSLITVAGQVTNEFFPTASQWRTDSVNITSITGSSGNVLVKFRNTENFENNLFLDNINIYTKRVPELLKKNGYLVYPNPTSGQFVIQHLVQPETLRGINIYTASGQLVYQKAFSGTTASTYIPVNLPHLASGVYMLRLIYTDKQITQKILKIN